MTLETPEATGSRRKVSVKNFVNAKLHKLLPQLAEEPLPSPLNPARRTHETLGYKPRIRSGSDDRLANLKSLGMTPLARAELIAGRIRVALDYKPEIADDPELPDAQQFSLLRRALPTRYAPQGFDKDSIPDATVHAIFEADALKIFDEIQIWSAEGNTLDAQNIALKAGKRELLTCSHDTLVVGIIRDHRQEDRYFAITSPVEIYGYVKAIEHEKAALERQKATLEKREARMGMLLAALPKTMGVLGGIVLLGAAIIFFMHNQSVFMDWYHAFLNGITSVTSWASEENIPRNLEIVESGGNEEPNENLTPLTQGTMGMLFALTRLMLPVFCIVAALWLVTVGMRLMFRHW